MADGTAIEWTDATWNPITGCSVISPGCTHCYAMVLAGTRLRNHPSRSGLTRETKAGPVWTGGVRLNENWLDLPIRWRRPRRIFVCAHGDLFHSEVPDAWIDAVFRKMAACPHHTFQVLTKRPDRMRAYCTTLGSATDGALLGRGFPIPISGQSAFPLPNVWLGVSVEDQRRADERVPHLLATPAALRFLSCEPLLGPVDIEAFLSPFAGDRRGVDWVIAGGESGPRARDMDPAWARRLRDQCAAAGVPFFHKQMARMAAIPADLLVREFPTMQETADAAPV